MLEKESTAIGKFCALCRHEMIVDQHFEPNKIFSNSYFEIGNFEKTIFELARPYGDIKPFLLFCKKIELRTEDAFWSQYAIFIRETIENINMLPESFLQTNLREDLIRDYLIAYERLMKPIGTQEFANFIGWDSKKFSAYNSKGILPTPFATTSATPLWTRGQTERFQSVLRQREVSSVRGDWETSEPFNAENPKMHLTVYSDTDGEVFYEPEHEAYPYYWDFIEGLSERSFEENLPVLQYLQKKSNNAPDVLKAMGDLFRNRGETNEAAKFYEMAIGNTIADRDEMSEIGILDEEFHKMLLWLVYHYSKEEENFHLVTTYLLLLEETQTIECNYPKAYEAFEKEDISIFLKWYEKSRNNRDVHLEVF